ncbi:MAG: tetratricopeptide repeat protein [Pseudomonadota bacterium]
MSFVDRLFAVLGWGATPEALVFRADRLAKKEDVSAAVEMYKKALAGDPFFVPAYDGLGKTYFRMGFRDEAEREFAIAEGLEKHQHKALDLKASLKLGRALQDKDLHKMALTLLLPVFKENPKHPELLKIIGIGFRALGQDKKALELFKAGLKRWPRDPDFYFNLGSLLNKMGKTAEGEKLVTTSRLMIQLESDPADVKSRVELARFFYDHNNFPEAAEYMRQAVGVEKTNPDYWQFLGDCYLKAGLQPAALDSLKQAVKLAPSDHRPQKAVAQVLQFMGRFEEARAAKELASILEAGGKNTQNPEQGAKYIKYLLSIGQGDDAENQLKTLLERWPHSLDLMAIQGRLLFRDKKYLESLTLLKSVAQQREGWAEPHIWMAMAYQKMGDTMSALAEGQLATRLAPKSYSIHKIFGDILREQKKFGMAENAYETAEHLKPTRKGTK